MNVIASEQVIFWDVDETLILWGKVRKGQQAVAVTCPYTGNQHYLRVHAAHVKILRDRYERGATNIVWSAAGYRWATAVVHALGLAKYVHTVVSKPVMYVDDKPAKEILGVRMYIEPNDAYGS